MYMYMYYCNRKNGRKVLYGGVLINNFVVLLFCYIRHATSGVGGGGAVTTSWYANVLFSGAQDTCVMLRLGWGVVWWGVVVTSWNANTFSCSLVFLHM